jgi:hypothetical protein
MAMVIVVKDFLKGADLLMRRTPVSRYSAPAARQNYARFGGADSNSDDDSSSFGFFRQESKFLFLTRKSVSDKKVGFRLLR